MTVIIYSVDQATGAETFQWSGDLDEMVLADDGLSDEDIAELRGMEVGDSVTIGGGAAELHRIKCVGVDKTKPVLTLV
jgi:hypothetical protein